MQIHDSIFKLREPVNEPIRPYGRDTVSIGQRTSLKAKLEELSKLKLDIPLIINGKEIRTGNTRKVVEPHAHGNVLAEFHLATPELLEEAANGAIAAQRQWSEMSWFDRAQIFTRAADLIAGPYRDTINASTMLGQSKNVHQAEIDAACELIDFLRFNAYFYQNILSEQPLSVPGVTNRLDWRPLEGFVLAITPFNFTAIAGNLPAAPAMLGNVALWKPSDTQMFSAYFTMKVFMEAGLPPGVIQFIPADGPMTSQVLLKHPSLAGIHFTGSTPTFQTLWKTVGQNLSMYRSYPRLVGETGGKDFVFVHPSADIETTSTALIRGAYEYQGQKCSAASRTYIPRSLWTKLQPRLVDEIKSIKMGDVRDFSNFVTAVIDKRSFEKIQGYLDYAKSSSEMEVLAGGKGNASVGYFVEPTLLLAKNPRVRTMCEEIFGPVLSAFVYEDRDLEATIDICNDSSPYALTGAIIAEDRFELARIAGRLRYTAGNMYFNDKPTGAVVGQQPFGGGRASGTNDKAGSALNLYRWLSPRTIKESTVPVKDYRYPYLFE